MEILTMLVQNTCSGKQKEQNLEREDSLHSLRKIKTYDPLESEWSKTKEVLRGRTLGLFSPPTFFSPLAFQNLCKTSGILRTDTKQNCRKYGEVMEISKVHIERMNFQKTADLEINKLHSDLTEGQNTDLYYLFAPGIRAILKKITRRWGGCVYVRPRVSFWKVAPLSFCVYVPARLWLFRVTVGIFWSH